MRAGEITPLTAYLQLLPAIDYDTVGDIRPIDR